MTHRILIVEDDENLRLALEDNLKDEGFLVDVAADGKSARTLLGQRSFRVIILDIMLPDTDGYTLCREIREQKLPSAVLMLTARSLESDLVEGFDAGADDYLAKPYRLRELLARVHALCRRGGGSDATADVAAGLSIGDFSIDLEARRVSSEASGEVELTRTEFDLLVLLVRNEDKALSRQEILERAWDPDVVVDPRTVDNFVSNLKRKLGWKADDSYKIATVRGVGYRFERKG